MRGLARNLGVGLAPLTLIACLPELETIAGARILYEYSDELHPCGGNAEYLDWTIPFLEQQLGVLAPEQLRYSWLSETDLAQFPDLFVRHKKGGLAIGQHAMSSDAVLVHEVVHLLTDQLGSPFFREGVAVAYDMLYPEGYGLRYPPEISFDPRRTMDADTSLDVDYLEAGLFVSFILTRHGPEKFLEFYESLRRPYTLHRARSAFSEIYGIDLDIEVELFMQGVPDCPKDSFNLQFPDCAAPVVPWSGPIWFVIEPLECDAAGVVGGGGPRYVSYIFKPMTLEVPEAGRYELRNGTDPDVWIRFGPCFGCPWDFKDVNLEDNESVQLDLEAGKYYLRTITTAGEPRTAGVSLHRLDG